MREIALDTETTGLDPEKGHRIVEIGCVEMFDRLRTGRHVQFYLNPQRDMPEEARAVHGLSSEFLADKPLFSEVVEEFLEFIGDSPLVIHNAGFDMKFLNYELKLLGFPPIAFTRAVDTVTMARRKFPGSPASLDALCKRFTIDLSTRTKHGALLDAELLADVYLELCGGRQPAISFDLPETENQRAAEGQVTQARITIPQRHFPASEEEREAHRDFVQAMKNPLWAES